MKRTFAGIALGVSLLWIVLWSAPRSERDEQLRQHINLGKAFYENPTTQTQAVEQFQKALALTPDSAKERLNYGLALLRAAKTKEGTAELEKVQKADPKLPHTWWNLAIVHKKEGNFDEATRQLREFIRLVPDEPISHYNLGVLLKLAGQIDQATAEFERAGKLDENLAAPHFQLYNAYRQAGKAAEAAQQLKLFQERKKGQEVSGVTEDMEWNNYSEIYEVIPPADQPESTQPSAYTFEAQKLPGDAMKGLTVLDVDGDSKPDLLAWGTKGIQVYRSGAQAVKQSAFDGLQNVMAVTAGDFNNDGWMDLCILASNAPLLYVNQKGTFAKQEAALPSGTYSAALWLDYDHDYDLDLFLLGAKPALLRNQGAAGFADHTADFPFQPGDAIAALPYRRLTDSKMKDLVVAYRDHAAVLYEDKLTGRYQPLPLAELPAGANSLSIVDADRDGSFDIGFTSGGKARLLLNHQGRIESTPLNVDALGGIVFADLGKQMRDNLVAGGRVASHGGAGRFTDAVSNGLTEGVSWVAADFDQDGRIDLAGVGPDGSVQRYLNKTQTTSGWLSVKLKGIKNLVLAPGAEVEVKAGASYQKKRYEGLPLIFGLDGYKTVDTVRITWPNGLIQNETNQPAGKAFAYDEAQRLSGSCPLIYTWNGREYEYITDVLGVAPLGAMSGDGQFFPTDHDEYVSIPGSSLAPRDGAYEIRMTEELSEVSYLDQLQLVAVDHPADTDVFSNEKWKGPPFPDFRLYGVRRRIYPKAARDDHGHDVRPALARKDRVYPDDFRRDYNGVAEMHSLTLGFGASARENRAVLVLSGWVDWADGSTFLNQSQEGSGLVPPRLQVKDNAGQWQTVVEDMGMPSGKPKTIAVDLTGKFLSQSREVRIVTNLCVYWDEIFLGEDSGAAPVKLTRLSPMDAQVQFRGFSRSVVHPERRQPEQFSYAHPMMASYWNPTPGHYTRYGNVTPLLQQPDDRMVVMGSGDELRARFPSESLPTLPSGWRRDFLLLVDGWAKDRDANTAFSQTVEPLPFHAMSRYPYAASEHYPDTPEHRAYVEEYNTRLALQLIRPLLPEKRKGWQ